MDGIVGRGAGIGAPEPFKTDAPNGGDSDAGAGAETGARSVSWVVPWLVPVVAAGALPGGVADFRSNLGPVHWNGSAGFGTGCGAAGEDARAASAGGAP